LTILLAKYQGPPAYVYSLLDDADHMVCH